MAQTINVANIKIGMNVEEIKKSGGFARQEIAMLARTAKASETPFQKLAKDVAVLDRAFATGAMDAATYNAMLDTLAKKHGTAAAYADQAAAKERKLADARAKSMAAMQRQQLPSEIPDPFKGWATDQQTAKVGGLTGSLKGTLAAATAIGATKMIFDFGKASAQVAMQREQVQAQMEVLTGSKESADKLIASTIKLDQVSALSSTQFQDSAKVLLGYGLTTNEVIPSLEKLSEISMGNAEKMQSLTLAFGQVAANGRLMGQEVLQMVNAGFNPLQEISRTTGESMASLRKRMEDGKVSFEEVRKAIDSATASGGRFYGMNDKMAGTTAVKLAKISSWWEQLKAKEGAQLLPGINKALDGFISLTEMGKTKVVLSESEVALEKMLAPSVKARAEAEAKAAQAARDKQKADEESLKAIAEQNKKLQEQADSAKKSFQSQIESIAEANEKAIAGDVAFEESKLRFQQEFSMSLGDRMQAESAILQMRETRAIGMLRSLKDEYEKLTMSEDQLLKKQMDEQRISPDNQRKIEGWKKAIDAEKERKKIAEEIAQIERDSMTERQKSMEELGRLNKLYSTLSDEEKTGQKGFALRQKAQDVTRRFAQSEVDKLGPNIAPAIKAGTVEAYKFMLAQQQKNKDQEEIKKIQADMLKEIQESNKLAASAPRLARA